MEITAKIEESEVIAKFEAMAEAILATLEDIRDALIMAEANVDELRRIVAEDAEKIAETEGKQ